MALLGGEKVFRHRVADAGAFHRAVREGLPYGAFEALLRVLAIRSRDLGELVGAAARTLARRKTEKHLTPIESDRLYRIAHVTHLAAETLGSVEKARSWLHRNNRAMGGEAPIRHLDTEIGVGRVEELLHRITHGIHS